MKLGLVLLLIYVAYNVAAYGAPELKVLGVVASFILAIGGAATNAQKKTKVTSTKADKLYNKEL